MTIQRLLNGIGTPLIIYAKVHELFIVEMILEVLWLNAHAGTAIICACLPTYGPLFSQVIFSLSNKLRKYYTSSQEPGSRSANPESSGDYDNLSNEKLILPGVNSSNGVRVQHTVEIA
jgi:hypothetical protein